jgi:hypothetical protein
MSVSMRVCASAAGPSLMRPLALRPRLTTSLPLSSTWLIGTTARHLIRRNYGNCHLRIGEDLTPRNLRRPVIRRTEEVGTLWSVFGHVAGVGRGANETAWFVPPQMPGAGQDTADSAPVQAVVRPASPERSVSSSRLSGASLARESIPLFERNFGPRTGWRLSGETTRADSGRPTEQLRARQVDPWRMACKRRLHRRCRYCVGQDWR